MLLDELTDIYVGKKTDVLKSKAAALYLSLSLSLCITDACVCEQCD